MILYNVTVKVNREIHNDWLGWMKAIHIPDVMDTGLFEAYKLCKLLFTDETDGITYAIQYACKDLQTLEQYQKEFAPKLQKEHAERYKDKYVAFRTLLEIVE